MFDSSGSEGPPDRGGAAAGGTLSALVCGLAAHGDRPFLAVAGQAIPAAAFAERVLATARGLCGQGFGPGDRLAVHLHRCIDEATAVLAAAVAGGVAVPIHPKLKDDQVAHVLADCDPWGVVTSATKGALLTDPARVLAGRRLLASGAAPGGLAAQAFAALAEPVAGGALPVVAPDDPAILLYTSGSTGLAKGVVQSHRNLVRGAEVVAGFLRLAPSDHILALLPFSFDYGLNQLLSAMAVGCRVTAADFLGIGELGELLATVRPTGLAGVPTLWHDVARGLRSGSLPVGCGRSLRYVTNSGGRLGAGAIRVLRASWPACAIYSMYGLTEAFRSAFLSPELIDLRPDSFGKAVEGVGLLLVDPADGRVVEGAGTGELVHAGAFVAAGYWRRSAATAERFRPDPRAGSPVDAPRVVYTGDIVRRDGEGFLYFVGRRDGMLKVAGHRISPDEVAQALVGVDEAREVVVFGVTATPEADGAADLEADRGDRIVLCAAGDPADATLPARLLRHCRARLPAYMVPAQVVVLAALPRTANGKIDVADLRRRCLAGEWC